MRKALDQYYKYSAYAAAFSLCAICFIVFLQVIFNTVNKLCGLIFDYSPGLLFPSYGEITGFSLVATTFFAVAYTFRKGGHIRVNLILSRIKSKKVLFGIDLFSISAVTFLTLWTIVYSLRLAYDSWQFEDVSPGIIPIPLWIPQLFMTLGCITFLIALIDTLVDLLRGKPLPFE